MELMKLLDQQNERKQINTAPWGFGYFPNPMAFQDAIVDQLIRQNDTDDGDEVTLEGYFEAGFFTETFGWGLTR